VIEQIGQWTPADAEWIGDLDFNEGGELCCNLSSLLLAFR
jgi:hypothetical protein